MSGDASLAYPGTCWWCLHAQDSGTQLHASPDLTAVLASQRACCVWGIAAYIVPAWIVVVAPKDAGSSGEDAGRARSYHGPSSASQ